MPYSYVDDLSADQVRAFLDYDPRTGVFRWRHRVDWPQASNTRFAGKITGYTGVKQGGYRCVSIRINDRLYQAHRLAWLHFYGVWPEGGLDHRDRDGTHNWINNLRAATQGQNLLNRGVQSNSLSGIKGVGRHGKTSWRARVRVGGQVLQKVFPTAEEATIWQAETAQQFHGEFAPR